MRMPPLLADFIHNRVCKPICEKLLTLPDTAVSLKKGDFNTLPAIHSIIGNSGFCAILNKKADNT